MTPTIRTAIYGRSALPESDVIQGGSAEVRYPIVFAVFLITCGERQILIDAGCDTMPNFIMEDFISPADALLKIGVKADEITDIIVTHAHHDHIDGVRHFKNAVIHIQEDEYAEGKKYIPDGQRVELFSESCIVGETVTVEKIGGHTVGSCIAKVNIDGTTFVFCGDECYLRLCLERGVPTGYSFCLEKSLRFVEEYSSERYRTIVSHDPELMNFRDGYIS